MLNTAFAPGAPAWLDLGTPDLDATSAFYSGLFGWEPVSAGPDAGGYGFWAQDGKTVAAYGPLAQEGAVSAWTVYFAAPDADATAQLVQAAGGGVRVPPMDVMSAGRMAHFTDPAGADFAVWQAGDTRGLDQVGAPGSLTWVELHTPDTTAARAFYDKVFTTWTFTDQSMGAFTYTVISTGGQEDSLGGLMPDESAHWLPYFEVPNCDDTVATATKLGATVLHPAETLPGVGRMALLQDTHNARFSVITSETPS